jgi:hypothetical protein
MSSVCGQGNPRLGGGTLGDGTGAAATASHCLWTISRVVAVGINLMTVPSEKMQYSPVGSM